ncbi:MAG TPA: protein translocase subunit SecD [Anaerolineae bacterium]|nr:protein translocase subunit SecD [Anaerolineae bacterium]
MSRSYTRWLIPILIIVAAAIWVVLPTNPGIHIGSYHRDIKIVQGLDLQGGLQVLLEADLPPGEDVSAEQMQTARDIIERRVNALGVSEPLVQVAGSNRILVELPGIGNPEDAVGVIKETGLLEFIQIPANEFIPSGTIVETDYLTGRVPETETDDDSAQPTPTPETSPGFVIPGAPEATAEPTPVTGEGSAEPTESPAPTTPVYTTVMTGAIIKNAYVSRDQTTNELIVAFDLTDEGSDIFGDYTTNHVGEILGIVLDKRLIAAPKISTPITTGSGYIEGQFSAEEANNLAVTLRYGSLPVALVTVETKSVGPTLGQDSLRKSTIAGFVGLLVVMVFMALYYRLPGLLADLALLVYAVITFSLFKLIPVTLTLPGIAGFVLSLGVAVDANVLIFERMKEELRSGLRLRQAIDLGFSRAWPSIRDSNLSTLITCGILYWFGNTFGASIVKGFSLTLALGVLVSLFTAITVTRTFLHIVLDNIKIADHPRWFGI